MSTGTAPVVEVKGLLKRFDDVTAVAGVDLVVHAGQVHGMVGPNGAGKTTVLAMLLGLVHPDAGTLRLFGRTRAEAGSRGLDGVAGFVESPRFYPYLSARQNLELLAGCDGGGRGSAPTVDTVLSDVGLVERAEAKVRGFSVGMRQRLGIAAALLRRPRLLVLDEPVSGLDPAGARDIRALVRTLAGDGVAILLSSHDMDEVEDLCGEVTIMARGRAAYQGSMRDLVAQAPDPAYRLLTSDDERAAALAAERIGLTATRHPAGGLRVLARQERLDAYVIALGGAGIAVRFLDLEASALKTFFFTLTEGSTPDDGATMRDGAIVGAAR